MQLRHFIFTILFLSVFIFEYALSQESTYKATWESIDSRPIPEWFGQAKFGIFIHWGPYSVPAWTPKGTYSEWYQFWLQNKTLFGNGNFTGSEVVDFHEKTYGKDFSYYDFGPMFTADLFNPDEWAEVFKNAGAKYIVITTKHHDGFCLWPSKEANDRGFAWNSMEVGASRDLIGDLTKSIKDAGIKMGFYYSLYEWYHPWWQNDRKRFVEEHFHPQFKDLVESYQPDIMWGDGEWDMQSKDWKSAELIAWLFNESSVKNTVLINDRWGKEIRKNHGGYFTTEYEAETSEFHRPWEECRGMGFSFGYNQNEDAWDYSSPKTLVLTLINIVSNGGNLLLDIGPDARGNIPPIMQDRLLEIGKWLKINGEAIYGTKKWERTVQWSEGKQGYQPEGQHYLGAEFILKQTIDPEPGWAVKEIFFTQKEDHVYAILPKWPGKKLIIKDFNANEGTKIILLATNAGCSWENTGNNLEIALPDYDPNLPAENNYAYVLKIEK
jgi:alpha-L-fucosidase